jgi:hypothetical protein
MHLQREYDERDRERRAEMSKKAMMLALQREQEVRGKIDLIKLPQPDGPDDYGLAPRWALINLTTAQCKVLLMSLIRYRAQCSPGSVAHQLLAALPTHQVF